MINKTLYIDITLGTENEYNDFAGVMWEHNATQMEFKLDLAFTGEGLRYYIEYRSCFGSKVRTQYLEPNEENIIVYQIPVEMSSLKAVEGYFCIAQIDFDGNTVQVIKPQKFNLTFDYSADIDNQLCKVNDFSINYLLEAIRNGTFKGDVGEKGDKGDKGDKGETGGISEVLAYKSFANALKHSCEGLGAVCTYASPLNAEADVSVSCKNLFDISQISTKTGLTNNGDGTLTVAANVYSMDTGKKLCECCPQLKSGDRVTLSLTTASSFADFIYISALGKTWSNGTAITVTEAILNSNVIIYGKHTSEADYGTENLISNIQIELGEAVTEYCKYTAPENLSIKKYGRNLLPYPFNETTKTENGITFTDNGDGTVTVNGTATANATFVLSAGAELPQASYSFTGCPTGGSRNNYFSEINIKNQSSLSDYGSGAQKDYSSATAPLLLAKVYIRIVSGTTVDNLTFKPQLEMNGPTDFEACQLSGEYFGDASGKVNGVVIDKEKTTLIPSTPAIIKCEYSRDTNAIINKIIELAQSLGVEF